MRAQRAGPDPAPGTRWINFERAMLRMVTATVIAVSVLGVCAAWCCGRDAGWREGTKADAHRMEIYKDWVWHLAGKARDLNDFKARYAVALTLDEGEANDGMGI